MKPSAQRLTAILPFFLLLFALVFAANNQFLQDDATPPGNSSDTSKDGVTWIFPPSASNSAFDSVDTLDAQWQSSFAKPNLALWCKALDGPAFKSRNNSNVVQTGSHAVLLDISQVAQTVICHLTLQDTSNLTLTSDSSPFTIAKAPNAAPHTWSAKSPTGLTPSVATSQISATTGTSSSTAVSTGPSNDPMVSSISSTHGISTAAGVGIGMGVAALVSLLALGALLLFLYTRRRRKQSENHSIEISSQGCIRSYNDRSRSNVMMKKNTIRVIPGVHETVGNRPVPQELDASAATLARTTNESLESESDYRDFGRGHPSPPASDGSRTPESMSRRIVEREGLGDFI